MKPSTDLFVTLCLLLLPCLAAGAWASAAFRPIRRRERCPGFSTAELWSLHGISAEDAQRGRWN